VVSVRRRRSLGLLEVNHRLCSSVPNSLCVIVSKIHFLGFVFSMGGNQSLDRYRDCQRIARNLGDNCGSVKF
jgi:hypothetical protein